MLITFIKKSFFSLKAPSRTSFTSLKMPWISVWEGTGTFPPYTVPYMRRKKIPTNFIVTSTTLIPFKRKTFPNPLVLAALMNYEVFLED